MLELVLGIIFCVVVAGLVWKFVISPNRNTAGGTGGPGGRNEDTHPL